MTATLSVGPGIDPDIEWGMVGRPPSIHVGERYGRLTIIGVDMRPIPRKTGRAAWAECICDCGNAHIARGAALRSGTTSSCGCLHKERHRAAVTIHGRSHTRVYKAWSHMIDRCCRPHTDHYHSYGGRGISVCDEWRSDCTEFELWALANGYAPGLTLDRIDNDGNYEPSNCRWVTAREQQNNTTRNRWVEAFGEVKNVAQWALDPRCTPSEDTLWMRLKRGWSAEDALTRPLRRRAEPSRR